MPDPISNAEKLAKLTIRKDAFIKDIDRLADNLYSGRITLGMWEEDMRTRLREYLAGSAAIGKGGRDKMTRSDWGKVGAQVKKQYRWLHGFSKAIKANADSVTIQAIKARAHLYAQAGSVVATEMQAGYFAPNTRRTPQKVLPWLPGDGSTECLNQCGCIWAMEVGDELPAEGIKYVQATWVVDPAKENCEDCVPRDQYVEVVEVPINVEVPSFIGLGATGDL